MIQYLSDQVTYSAPTGSQTDYEMTINIVFSTSTDGALSPEYLYTRTVTGGTSFGNLLELYTTARQAITDDTLTAYAAGTPTLYTPPASGPPGLYTG